jgi:hypothetical protein
MNHFLFKYKKKTNVKVSRFENCDEVTFGEEVEKKKQSKTTVKL